MDRHWHSLEAETRSFPSNEIIANWEAQNVPLPAGYKRFMLKYDGGFIYPDMFRLNVDDPDDWLEDVDDPTQLNTIDSWKTFVERNARKDEIYSNTHVVIGSDITSNSILIDISGEHPGSVVFWYRNNDSWDEDDGPVPIGILAPSFEVFLKETLFARPDGPDSRWSTFLQRGSSEALEF